MSGHHHHHHHHDHHHGNNRKVLWVLLCVISAFMLVEALAGWLSNSLALLSDAGHMLSDALALALSLAAFRLGMRPADAQRSFGYRRFEIMAAAVNGLALLILSLWIVIEALLRLSQPQDIAGLPMLLVALLGLLVNIGVAWYMVRHGDTSGNLNMKSAYLHVLGDLLASVGALVAGLLIWAYGWLWADAAASALIALLIGKSAWGILRSSVHILMEGTPTGADMRRIAADIAQIDGVYGVHDLHAWTITSQYHAFSCHIVVDSGLSVAAAFALVGKVQDKVRAHGIAHVTVQTEPPEHGHDDSACSADTAQMGVLQSFQAL